ncbi:MULTISPECIES: hypothetical protein [unclassified Bradyrhizobium]|uniref:hypothetical protein n=1 Tax=unclassified Bradyrhizobium TaxID=2631580 RepID=UPI0034606764
MTTMTSVSALEASALEASFDIAWSSPERSGELRGAAKAADIILNSIEQQLRKGKRRKLVLVNRTISTNRARVATMPAVKWRIVEHVEGKMIRNEANARHLRDANKAFKATSKAKPLTDYAKAEQSFQENRERLKAERLAREARARDSSK